MKVAILGFSSLDQSESLPVYRYFQKKGAEITAYFWGEPDLPADVIPKRIEVGASIKGLDEYGLVVRGPAVHPRQITTTTPVTSLTNIFVEHSPTKNIIGVTGTKGKGTTCTLIAKVLEASGQKVWLGGNIGRPLLDDLDHIQLSDWVVLEMSAGQLIDFSQNIHLAVCLMVVPEHLDWHTDMSEYLAAKSNLFKHQTSSDTAIYFAGNENSSKIANASPGRKIPYYQKPGAYVREDGMVVIGEDEIMPKDGVKLLGNHNLQNICAAVTTVWQVQQNPEAIRQVLSSFSGLEHRLEFVREHDGVKYYDDSFGTTPETAIVALQAFSQPKVVILGGSDKGVAFDGLAGAVVKNNVRHAVLIGSTATKIKELLQARDFNNFSEGFNSMSSIVAAARQAAQPGDVVLLSTGCASFGLFKNYKDRGNQFKTVVRALA